MPIILGRHPEGLTLRLVPSDPFVCELVRESGVWDSGDVCRLEFPTGGPWTATVDGDTLRFNVAADAVDAVIAAGVERASLTLNGVVWAAGYVDVARA